METIQKIRLSLSKGMSIREAARKYDKSRATIRKIARSNQTRFTYERKNQPYPALGPWIDRLSGILSENMTMPVSKRRTVLSIYEELQGAGYEGSYSSVRRFCAKWKEENVTRSDVYIPQVFGKAEAFQFDWSTEEVEIGGKLQTIGVAHIRLCYSRMSFVGCYPLQKLEMVMDAHIKAARFLGGMCRRGIYDNLKSVVKRIGLGKEREFTDRMLELSSHYLFELQACTPAAGWEKGQVERQVQSLRERIFRDRLNFADFKSLQEYVEGRLIGLAKSTKHPEFQDKSVYEVYEEEKEYLLKPACDFDGAVKRLCVASATCLLNYERNQYSVPCKYAGKPVEIRAYAFEIRICHGGETIARHVRSFGKKQMVLDPLHYLPVLERKPGALRNGRPFREWRLPKSIEQVKEILLGRKGGDREAAGILGAIPQYGVDAVEVACELALEAKVLCKSHILNILSRVSEDVPSRNIRVAIGLKEPPAANCSRYDELRSQYHGA